MGTRCYVRVTDRDRDIDRDRMIVGVTETVKVTVRITGTVRISEGEEGFYPDGRGNSLGPWSERVLSVIVIVISVTFLILTAATDASHSPFSILPVHCRPIETLNCWRRARVENTLGRVRYPPERCIEKRSISKIRLNLGLVLGLG